MMYARRKLLLGALMAIGVAIPACGGGGGGGGFSLPVSGAGTTSSSAQPVAIRVKGANAVSYWNEVATTTINVPAASTGTPEEQRPITSTDLATVQLAIYDALMAITKSHRPFAAVPATAGAPDTSQEATVAAAAYGVLKRLFPSRTAQYQAAYDTFVAGIADSDAKAAGLALGDEIATGTVGRRANDGRSVVLAPYVPGTAPGRFRGTNPVNRYLPSVKPFSMSSAAQFRAPAPPALTSDVYAQDFNETRTLGGKASSLRTDAQLEVARFHTEPPPAFWPRNLRRFIMTDRSLEDQARLMAMVMVSQADAEIGCFDSKYFYEAWRPQSAIPLADTDGNDATAADPTWTPVVATPNHPEYPAAHACVAGAVTEALKGFFGTDQIQFSFDSTVTGSTHNFDSTQALVDEIRGARIYGGMHFRSALIRGNELGASVAQQALRNNFQAR